MKSRDIFRTVFAIAGCILLVMSSVPFSLAAGELQNPGGTATRWRETPPIRVVMKSTADWGRIMFDDEIGNNTNGIRFKYILSQGWFKGNGSDDEISVGKGTWYDVLYNVTVKKTGDIVAFNKQRNDFNYTEMYADIVFEIDVSMISGYVWLMLAGQGTTVFQLINSEDQYTFWQETLSGTGHTRHVRTYIMLDSFFRRWEVSPTSVVVLTLIAILMMVLLSPVVPRKGRRSCILNKAVSHFVQKRECHWSTSPRSALS